MPRTTAWLLLVRHVVVSSPAGTGAATAVAKGAKTVASPQVVRTKAGAGAARGSASGVSGKALAHFEGAQAATAGAGRGAQRKIHFSEFFGTPAPPGFELITAPYVPPTHTGLRFIARNLIDGQVVDWDLPLIDPEITFTLSGPTIVKGVIAPEQVALIDEHIDAWATWIDVENDGAILASGIVSPPSIDGEQFSIEAVGVAGYPVGVPYLGELSEIGFDALDAVRAIWAHLLSFPDGAPLGVELSQNTCGVLLGTAETTRPKLDDLGNPSFTTKIETYPPDDDPMVAAAGAIAARILGGGSVTEDLTWAGCPAEVTAYNDELLDLFEAADHTYSYPASLTDVARWCDGYHAHTVDSEAEAARAAVSIANRIQSGTTTNGIWIYEDLTWPGCPDSVALYNDYLLDLYQATGHGYAYPSGLPTIGWWCDGYGGYEGLQHSVTTQDTETVEAAPYQLAWWGDIDCGNEINTLAKAVPFDYVEIPRWNADRSAVVHHIELGFPRIGRLRTDLRFALDENLVQAFVIQESPDTYASQVVVRGKGEGRMGIRGYAGDQDPRRVRRVALVTDKNIPDIERANAVAADALRRRQSLLTVGEIVVHDWHDNARIGSYSVGDDIVVTAPISFVGDLTLTHRILSYTWRPDDGLVALRLARSEEFVYGRLPDGGGGG